MARKLLAGMVIAVALGAVGTASARQLPILRSAKAVNRHLVLGISVGDTRPTQLAVAKRRAVDMFGGLLRKNVRLRETIRLAPTASGVVRWQSPRALRPGVYFVQVMVVSTGGLTDCPKFLRNCNEHWSNVQRVIVPRPS